MMAIRTAKKLMKESQNLWLKNEKGKNNAPVEHLGTTPGENVKS